MLTRLILGFGATNCYIYAKDRSDALIIDPAADADLIASELGKRELTPKAIVITHAHIDHVLAVTDLKDRFKIPFWAGKGDLPLLGQSAAELQKSMAQNVDPQLLAMLDPDLKIPSQPDKVLVEGEILAPFGLTVWETPGHSPGGLSLVGEGLVFTGDTLFADGIGRDDLWGGDWDQLENSIRRLLTLPPATIVLPGHGPETTIGRERTSNPDLGS